jgi:hypothetical protein
MHETLEFAKATLSSTKGNPERFLGVLQGQTFEEFMDCAAIMHGMGVQWLSVPRHATSKIGTRQTLVTAVHDLYPEVKIHLLGFSDDVIDDMMSARLPGVQGIDSAMPIWAKQPLTSMSFPGKRPVDYMEWDWVPKEAVDNIRKVREWLNDVKDAPTKVTPADQGEI